MPVNIVRDCFVLLQWKNLLLRNAVEIAVGRYPSLARNSTPSNSFSCSFDSSQVIYPAINGPTTPVP